MAGPDSQARLSPHEHRAVADAPTELHGTSESVTASLKAPAHLVSLCFSRCWGAGGRGSIIALHLRTCFFCLVLYRNKTRDERHPQPRRTLRCRAQSPLTHSPTHFRRMVFARFALGTQWQVRWPLSLRRLRRHRLVVSGAKPYRQGISLCSHGLAGFGVRRSADTEIQRLLDEVSELEWKRFLARKG